LAVWSADLHRLGAPMLAQAKVAATVMEGAIVFRREAVPGGEREARDPGPMAMAQGAGRAR
ncbi:MAG TPA: hypothetical protein VJY35_14575, partial [Candidatus Eisenbacteria bacterium]|nr:hypothetical protein [Candidatus Eisenbacteria bacterium]